MEEKKTILDYLAQVVLLYGVMILMMVVFCMIFGDTARGLSSLFTLGSDGLSISILLQFLLISALVTLTRFLFFTDTIIKSMPIVLRTVLMLASDVCIIVVFVICFDWFPVTMWEPWALFAICFVASFGISLAVMLVKEKSENKKMEEALKKLKMGGGEQ